MSRHEPDRPKKDRFPALRSRDFRLFWTGQFVSRAGSHMQLTALNWHMYQLTGDPVSLAKLGLVRFIPVVLLSLVGGALADAVSRRRLLLVSQSTMMLSAAALGWLTVSGQITENLIYLLTAIGSGVMAIDGPARQALVVNLVPREHVANAVSLNSSVFQIATIIGPVVAGFLIGGGGIGFTYWLNAFSFLAVIWALLVMRAGDGRSDGAAVTLDSLREGIQFVGRTPIVLHLMLLDALATFFSSANVLLPMFAQDILHVDARGYGFLSAAPAVGSLAAATVTATRPAIRRQGMTVLVAVGVHGLATVGFGLSRHFALAFFFLALVGGSDTLSAILRQTIRQLATPDRLRGRVTAVNMLFFMGGPRLGELEAGMVASWIGAPLSVITGGIGCILTVALTAWRSPQMRAYAMSAEEEATPVGR